MRPDVIELTQSDLRGTKLHQGSSSDDAYSMSGFDAGSAPPSSIFLHSFPRDIPAISLDCIPRHTLARRIAELQKSLEAGASLLVGFTAVAQPSNLGAVQQSLIQVPFLRRATDKGRPQQRSADTLKMSLSDVIGILTNGAPPFTVEAVRKVSKEYAAFLHRCVEDLEVDPVAISAFMNEWGRQAWVEERLCTVWEAALVEVGWLDSWVIVVRKL